MKLKNIKKNSYSRIILCLIFSTAVNTDDTTNNPSIEDEVSYFPESSWGTPPVKVTKELIYKQYPHIEKFDKLKEQKKNEEQSDLKEETKKTKPIHPSEFR